MDFYIVKKVKVDPEPLRFLTPMMSDDEDS